MVSFKGYDDIIKRVYDHNQEHVFQYWSGLNDDEKKSLLRDLADIDFELMKKLFFQKEVHHARAYEPAPYIPVALTDKEKLSFSRAAERGVDHIRKGRVAAFIVAGGQGSRLGFEGPKGMFPVGPVSGKTLFQIFGEKIAASSRKYGTAIPWFVMTSGANHDETERYFRGKDFFGLKKENVFIFKQNMIPSLDTEGRLILETGNSIFKNPDGHGGSLTALRTSGALEEMKRRGIETISYFQVDNPLVRIIDPVFIGHHVEEGARISCKSARKAYPEEKVGVFVRYRDKKIGIVEYSDLPPEKVHERDAHGGLLYSSANLAIHLFERQFIEDITDGFHLSLPFHVARKNIRAFVNGGWSEIGGFKYEKFVFDTLSLTEKNIIMDVVRQEEFAPVKNAAGPDSLETSQELMVGLHRKWLTDRGIIPGPKVKIVEISPFTALEAEDLSGVLAVPDTEKVYLGEDI